jgi:hypothetical protein
MGRDEEDLVEAGGAGGAGRHRDRRLPAGEQAPPRAGSRRMPQEKLPNETLGIDGPQRFAPERLEKLRARHAAIIRR